MLWKSRQDKGVPSLSNFKITGSTVSYSSDKLQEDSEGARTYLPWLHFMRGSGAIYILGCEHCILIPMSQKRFEATKS